MMRSKPYVRVDGMMRSGKTHSIARLFCEHCQEERSYNVVPKTSVYRVKGHEVEASFDVAVCDVCGLELDHEELSDIALETIQENFINQVGLNPEKIRAIRKIYKLGIRPFSKLIGIGAASVSRLESGSLPNSKQARIYLDLDNDSSRILAYFEANKGTLSARELKSTMLLLDSWRTIKEADGIEEEGDLNVQEDVPIEDEQVIEAIYRPNNYSELNGYKRFDFKKLVQMIVYFSRNGVNKTKLMKLLWYADFVHFKRQSISISGATYARLRYGPVPRDHEIVLSHLQRMQFIFIDQNVINDEGWLLETVKSNEDALSPNEFSDTEFSVLREVEDRFKDFGSRKISDYSHMEKAWIETPPENLIDYAYAIDLNDF